MNFLDIKNDYGLTGIFQDGLNFSEAVTVLDNEKMIVITSGESPPNPSEMLASERMDQILGRLEELVDIVVIDSPPFIVADTIDLGSKVDGVLIVIRPGFTRKKVAKAMMEQFKMSEARMLGVVLNRIPQKGLANYGGYYYDSPYYSKGDYFEGENMSQEEGQLQRYRTVVQSKINKLRERYQKL